MPSVRTVYHRTDFNNQSHRHKYAFYIYMCWNRTEKELFWICAGDALVIFLN